MVLETYPLDNVDYSAEDAELFHCTRSSGIYANDDFDYSVTGADNTITIGVGLGWIRNSRFSGKVVALKAAMTLDMGLPDAVYPRIDAVVIQFDANKNGTEIVVKRGVAASAPAAPSISKTESLYELHLLHVRREPGASAVSVYNITDLRLDPNYCGLMADSVTQIDTAAISAQVNALIESLRLEIQSVKDGSAYLMRSGGTMSGPINMNGQALKGLNAPTTDDEAVNLGTAKKIRPRNLLDNSDFTNPVNQRGLTVYPSTRTEDYTIDRWFCWRDYAIEVRDGYIHVDNYISQYIEKHTPNQTYTVACKKLDGTIAILSGAFAQGLANDLLKMGVANGYAFIQIYAGDYVWAAVYEGEYTAETLPEYQPKGYGAELAECMRYYQRSYLVDPTGDYEAHLTTATSNYSIGAVFFYVPMRITPTVTVYDPFTATAGCVGRWSDESNVPINCQQNARCFHVTAKNGAAVKGEGYALHYEASADL